MWSETERCRRHSHCKNRALRRARQIRVLRGLVLCLSPSPSPSPPSLLVPLRLLRPRSVQTICTTSEYCL